MLQLILHIYVFLAWTGPWSSHSGFGAFFFCCLWFVTLGLGLFSAFVAPSILAVIISFSVRSWFGKEAGRTALNVVDMIYKGFKITFMLPMLGVAGIALFCYFFGAGEELHGYFPSIFPKGGYFFSDTPIPFYAYAVIGYLAWTYYSMLDRFEVTDGIKANLPIVKAKSARLFKQTSQWTVKKWKRYAPIVRARSSTILAQTLRQAKACGRLNVELTRHFAMRLGLLAMSGGTSNRNGSNSSSEREKTLTSIRCRIKEHSRELKTLLHESRHFTISLGVMIVLITLILILT